MKKTSYKYVTQYPQFMSTNPWYNQSVNIEDVDYNNNISVKKENNLYKNIRLIDEDTITDKNNTNYINENTLQNFSNKGFAPVPAKKYRPGACENCGAISHKRKDCFERPRAKGAKWTNKNIAKDEIFSESKLDYEGQHDTWNGYDPELQKDKILEYELIQEAKLKEQIKYLDDNKNNNNKEELGDNEDNEDNEDLEHKEFNQEQFIDNKNCSNAITRPISESNYIIDDYKKYIYNLSTNNETSYDRDNILMSDDNKLFKKIMDKTSGDALNYIEKEKFIKEANLKNPNLNLNLVSAPTQAEMFIKYSMGQSKNLILQKQKLILEKYGGNKYYNAPEEILNSTNTNTYTEFNKFGNVINKDYKKKDNELADSKIKVKSENTGMIQNSNINKESIIANNHSKIFGSYFDKKYGWGYKCCLSFDYNSNCKLVPDVNNIDNKFNEVNKLLNKKRVHNIQ